MKLKPGDTRTAEVEVAFKCIGCEKEVTVAKDVESGEHMVLHEEPTCHTFDSMDPLTFVTEARKKYQEN
jgi:hypothetical protein